MIFELDNLGYVVWIGLCEADIELMAFIEQFLYICSIGWIKFFWYADSLISKVSSGDLMKDYWKELLTALELGTQEKCLFVPIY